MKRLKLLMIPGIFLLAFMFSCSDSGTNPTDEAEIPDGVVEFQSPQEAFEIGKTTLPAIGGAADDGFSVFMKSSNLKKISENSDTLYYSNGWWYYNQIGDYSDTTFSIKLTIKDKCQFLKSGTAQREWQTAEKAHAILNNDFEIISNGTTISLILNSDLTNDGLQNGDLMISGGGSYDMNLTTGEITKRYYFLYEFKSFHFTENDMPSGIFILKTKKYVITFTFNGTDHVSAIVTKDGSKVYSTTFSLDDLDDSTLQAAAKNISPVINSIIK
jgi:hypothetical protein